MHAVDRHQLDDSSVITAIDAKLHGGMCNALHPIVSRLLEVFSHVEASRPRSKSGIEALCSLHVALDKAKLLLQHCCSCSKLYLAITGETILFKFERSRTSLLESLGHVELIVSDDIGCQIREIVGELERIDLALDPTEKEAGEEIVNLILRNRGGPNAVTELDDETMQLKIFQQAAVKLGITSSRAAIGERRALKRLVDRARRDDDKRKESVVLFLHNLMRKLSNVLAADAAGEDTDNSQCSSPCSPMALDDVYRRNLSSLQSFNSRHWSFNSRFGIGSFSRNTSTRSGATTTVPLPPLEFRCPISLQLMHDPVIISSGQTYERACIEKWFQDGHRTCPRTQQQLANLDLTPNYCVKALISSWCEHNELSMPALLSCSSELNSDDTSSCSVTNPKENYKRFISVLQLGTDMREQCRVVERIRYLLKDDDVARIQMGAAGFAGELVRFLRSAVDNGDENAQEIAAMALFNLAVNNNRNKKLILSAGVVDILETMISNPDVHEATTALYLSLSSLAEAQQMIGSSNAVPFLIQILQSDDIHSGGSCKHDALYALYNLSTHRPNVERALSAGILNALHRLLVDGEHVGPNWREKVLAVIISLSSMRAACQEILATQGLVATITALLDDGEPTEQEQAAVCLLLMCNTEEKCIAAVLQEGVVPSLVAVSANGTVRGKEKAQKLLKLFRDHRQREPQHNEPSSTEICQTSPELKVIGESNALCRSSRSKRLGRTLSSLGRVGAFRCINASC